MNSYTVTVTVEVDSDSFYRAAQDAMDMLRTDAECRIVTVKCDASGESIEVDLEDPEEEYDIYE